MSSTPSPASTERATPANSRIVTTTSRTSALPPHEADEGDDAHEGHDGEHQAEVDEALPARAFGEQHHHQRAEHPGELHGDEPVRRPPPRGDPGERQHQ